MPHPADWGYRLAGAVTPMWEMRIHGAILTVAKDTDDRFLWGVRWPKKTSAGVVQYPEQTGGHGVCKTRDEAMEAALEVSRQGRPPTDFLPVNKG